MQSVWGCLINMKKESNWEKIVLICSIILAVIFLFKVLFWGSILIVIIGVAWLIFNFFTEDHDLSWIPTIMVIGGILLAFFSYPIGYGFEKSGLGKPIVDGAKTIVQTDDTLKDIEQNATNQIISATQQIIGENEK